MNMALPALGLDPGSVLGLLLIQLLLLLPPEATTTMTTPGISGQEPIPRVKYHIGKWPVAGRCGESNIGREIGDGCRDMCVLREGAGMASSRNSNPEETISCHRLKKGTRNPDTWFLPSSPPKLVTFPCLL